MKVDYLRSWAFYVAIIFLTLILPIYLPAQDRTGLVKGIVESNNNDPVRGVSVIIRNIKNNFTSGVSTDTSGIFSFSRIPSGGPYSFTFSAVGYESQTLSGYTLKEGIILSLVVKMKAVVATMNDVVVIGYGTSRKRNITGSVASINTEEIAQRSPTNAFEAIQGQMSGVQITSSSGAPGDNASIRIRGVSTFDAGADPLYIVDGQPLDNIDNINPNDISSIEILKDGSSAAIYGSKSANGVVIISTKTAKKNESKINVTYTAGFTTARIMPVATTNDRIKYEQFQGIIGTAATLDTFNQQFYNNNNFQDLMYQTGVRHQVNIGVVAGSEKTKIYWNTGFLNQTGLIRTTEFIRLNSRLNVDHTFNDRVIIGTRTSLSFDMQKNIDPSFETDLIGVLLTKAPFSTIYDIDGSFLRNVDSYRGRQNPLFEYTSMDVRKRNLRGNIFNYVEVKLFKDLKYRANIAVDFDYSRNTNFFPAFVRTSTSDIRSDFSSSIAWNWLHESFFNYDKTIGNHQVSAVAGISAQRWSRPAEQIGGLLASSLIPTLNNASQILITSTNTTDQDNHSLASVFGRLSYNYKSKYLLSGTIRRDGSSRFGPANKWGNFPSISGGWRFSDESFMKSIKFINDAKLRAGFAITGNERIGNQDYQSQLTTGNYYNSINGVGFSSRLANPGIQWEETRQSNVGLDFTILNRKVNLTIDYYIKNTVDLLANQPLPSQTGLNDVRVNLGNVQNKGFEFAIQATPYTNGVLTWKTNFNFSTNLNKVQKLAGAVPIVSSNYITKEGSPLGSFYGYNILGVFAYDESNAFSADGQQLTLNFSSGGAFKNYTLDGNPYTDVVKKITVAGIISKGGDFYWKDYNGDFQIDEKDRVILGNPYPKYFGGFRNQISYKSFEFSFLFDYQFDVQVYNAFMQGLSQLKDNAPTPPPYVLNNFWTGPGDETAIFPGGPRRVQNQLGSNAPTSYWVEDADFIKLRNVKISYDFPVKLTKKLKISNLAVYGSINNAFVWTGYRGFDPEVNVVGSVLTAGQDNARYPRGREVIFGINANF